jgi:hypothetical protein
MRRTHAFPPATQALALFFADNDLKQHPSYREAKAGDAKAALALVIDLAVKWLFENESRFPSGAVYVAPHAKEASGDNAIPQTLASVCATVFQGTVDREVVQTDRVYHTGANAMERMASRATFEGQVVPGAKYVLVDDVTNLGGTLAELNNYILSQGGKVIDVVVLVNAGRNLDLLPNRKDVRLIKERFQHEFIEIFGIEPEALTANEARYLVGFRSVDEIRDCLAKAREEIDRRLRAKGISRPGSPETRLQHGAELTASSTVQDSSKPERAGS